MKFEVIFTDLLDEVAKTDDEQIIRSAGSILKSVSRLYLAHSWMSMIHCSWVLKGMFLAYYNVDLLTDASFLNLDDLLSELIAEVQYAAGREVGGV